MTSPKRERKIWTGPRRHRDPEPWEVEILALISEHIAIPMDLLGQFLKLSEEDAHKLMKEFAGYRWVEMKKFILADKHWVWLRKSGAEHAGTGFRQVTPAPFGLPHRRAVCVARLKLEELYPDGRWICERALWHRKAIAHHVPDGVFVLRNEEGRREEWAIEAELTRKQMDRYKEIAEDRCLRYDRLLYFCSPFVGKLLRRIPEFKGNPRVTYEECFKDTHRLKLFRWIWSEASGPGEKPTYRQAEQWEVAVLRLISEQGAIPVDQLARFLGRSYETAQRIADHLDRAGFISQARGPADDPPWLWTTKMGGRLAGTGLYIHWTPSTTGVGTLRLQNEARLYVEERDPDARWWSMRLLRRGAEDKRVPVAIVEDDEEQHAVMVESRKYSRSELIEKYERLCGDFHAVAVFCSPRRVKSFNRLKAECGWGNMFARSFDPLRPPEGIRRRRARRPIRLTEIPVEDLPTEGLEKVRKAERLPKPPQVTLVERYSGRGIPMWRVTTASRQWRVAKTPRGWFARPTSELDERIEVPESVDEPPKPKRGHKAPVRGMKKISLKRLPKEVLKAIQDEAGLPSPPTALSAKRRRGVGFPRWLVTTDAGLWRVTETPQFGWSARLVDGEDEASGDYRKTRWPKDPPGVMVDVDPWDLPNRVVEEIQRAADMLWPPRVLSAQKRPGPGALRWRVVTDADTWRVTKVGQEWSASLSE